MTELRTNASLLSRLKEHSSQKLSKKQLESQRLSFVLGVMPTKMNMTREEIQGILEQQENCR